MTRTFIAVEIEKSIRDQIGRITDEIAKNNKDIRALPPSNIHLTLKFLGDRSEKEVKKIIESVSKAAFGMPAFNAELCKNIDAFPNTKKARVLIFKFLTNNRKLEDVFKKVEQELLPIGIKKEKRKFIPHVSVARTRSLINVKEIAQKDQFSNNLKVGISNITIFSSILKKTGAQYSIIERFDLK